MEIILCRVLIRPGIEAPAVGTSVVFVGDTSTNGRLGSFCIAEIGIDIFGDGLLLLACFYFVLTFFAEIALSVSSPGQALGTHRSLFMRLIPVIARDLLQRLTRLALLSTIMIADGNHGNYFYILGNKENTRLFFDLIDRRYNKEGNFNMVFTSNKNPALWREDFNEDSTLLCALDRIFDEATVFKLRGESFRGKKLNTVSVQTGKVKAVELLADQQEE